jgi:hypothetical protein
MADNIHPVVELLAARMESHPEEFGANGSGRWAEWLDQLIPFVTEEERVMLRKPMIQDIHEDVLDELLNGPERRAEEMRKREEDAERYRQHQQAMQHGGGGGGASLPVSTSPYQNAAGAQGLGIGAITPSQPLTIQSGGTGATRIQTNGGIQIGNETLNEGVLKQIKNALGIK